MSNLQIRASIARRRIKQAKRIADLIESGDIDGTPHRVKEIRENVKKMTKDYQQKFIQGRL